MGARRETTISLFASGVVVIQQIAVKEISKGMGDVWAAFITSIVAIFLIISFAFLLLRLRDIKVYRRSITKTGKFEGFYFSTVSDKDAPYSISKIYYSTTNRHWVHHGYALTSTGVCVKEWRVTSNYFDQRDKEWYFNGKWWPLVSGRDGGPQKGQESDQISIVIMPKEADQRPQSLFFDDPRKAARSNENELWLARAGQATMHFIKLDKLRVIANDPSVSDIEDMLGAPSRLLVESRDRLFRT